MQPSPLRRLDVVQQDQPGHTPGSPGVNVDLILNRNGQLKQSEINGYMAAQLVDLFACARNNAQQLQADKARWEHELGSLTRRISELEARLRETPCDKEALRQIEALRAEFNRRLGEQGQEIAGLNGRVQKNANDCVGLRNDVGQIQAAAVVQQQNVAALNGQVQANVGVCADLRRDVGQIQAAAAQRLQNQQVNLPAQNKRVAALQDQAQGQGQAANNCQQQVNQLEKDAVDKKAKEKEENDKRIAEVTKKRAEAKQALQEDKDQALIASIREDIESKGNAEETKALLWFGAVAVIGVPCTLIVAPAIPFAHYVAPFVKFAKFCSIALPSELVRRTCTKLYDTHYYSKVQKLFEQNLGKGLPPLLAEKQAYNEAR